MDIVTNAHAKRINGRYHALKGRMFSRSSTQIGILTFSKHGTKNEHQIATVAGNCLRYLDDVETYTLGANLKYEHFLYVYLGTLEPKKLLSDSLRCQHYSTGVFMGPSLCYGSSI
jgi:hypothetical protein